VSEPLSDELDLFLEDCQVLRDEISSAQSTLALMLDRLHNMEVALNALKTESVR